VSYRRRCSYCDDDAVVSARLYTLIFEGMRTFVTSVKTVILLLVRKLLLIQLSY